MQIFHSTKCLADFFRLFFCFLIIGDRFTVINPSNFLGSLHYLSPDPIDQGSQRGTDIPQPLQAARSQGEAAEEQFDKGVPDNRGGEAADGHAVPV